jgi:hypothetical protein
MLYKNVSEFADGQFAQYVLESTVAREVQICYIDHITGELGDYICRNTNSAVYGDSNELVDLLDVSSGKKITLMVANIVSLSSPCYAPAY